MGSRSPCTPAPAPRLFGVMVCCSPFLQSNGNQRDLNVQEAWEQGYTGRGVVVSILDDGIEKNHPDLEANYVSGGEDGHVGSPGRGGQRPLLEGEGKGPGCLSLEGPHFQVSPSPAMASGDRPPSGQRARLQGGRCLL